MATKIEKKDIVSYAETIAKNIVYYNNDVWKYIQKEGWVNCTKDTNSSNTHFNAIRLIVRNELIDMLGGIADPKNIDDVMREVKTIMEGKRYNFRDVKPGLYFKNGRLYWDHKTKELIFDEGCMDFTPNTIKIDFNQTKLDLMDKIYPDTVLKRFIDNISTKHTDTIFEYMGNILAFNHTGAALVIDGNPGIGKTTLGVLVSSAFAGTPKNEDMMHKINGADFMTGSDQFFLAGGVNKPIWFVSEASEYLSPDRAKWFNETIDDTLNTINIRMPHAAAKPFPKVFNLVLATNGPIKFRSNDLATELAVKQRLVVVKSESKGGVLNLDEWNSLFHSDELEAFIYMSIHGYKRTLISNKQRNKRFSTNDVDTWSNSVQNTDLVALTVMDSLSEVYQNKYIDDKLAKELNMYGVLWAKGEEIRMLNSTLNTVIAHAKKIWPNEVPAKYKASTFKKEMEKWCNRQGMEAKTNFWVSEENRTAYGILIPPRKEEHETSDKQED